MKYSFAAAIFALALPVSAQVSLDELDSAASQADSAMDEYRARLNDPDPDRALAVLSLLISKGDTDQRRLAIRHGLQSTDRAIQATTLRAILDSKPTLRVVFDPVSEEPNTYYYREINGSRGVIDTNGNGSVTFKINGFDQKSDCWTNTQSSYCFVQIRGDEVSLSFGNSWGNYRLDNSGRLVGEQSINKNLTKATIDLSE